MHTRHDPSRLLPDWALLPPSPPCSGSANEDADALQGEGAAAVSAASPSAGTAQKPTKDTVAGGAATHDDSQPMAPLGVPSPAVKDMAICQHGATTYQAWSLTDAFASSEGLCPSQVSW